MRLAEADWNPGHNNSRRLNATPRREFLAQSFALTASLFLSQKDVLGRSLFNQDFYFPRQLSSGRVNQRIYLRREASRWHQAEQADFILWHKDGRIDANGYRLFCWFLRDVRGARMVQVDMRLAALLTALQSHFSVSSGTVPYYHLTSGYRSWETNDATEGAAADSGHVYAGAADGWIEGVGVTELAAVAQSLRAGGVGAYKKRGFVHTDVVGKPILWKA